MTTITTPARPKLNREELTAFVDDGMTMTKADWKLNPKQFQKKRAAVRTALENFLPNRFVLVVGVTEEIQVASGDAGGAMHPGRAYQIGRGDFEMLKMDPARGEFLVVLEPKVPNMYFEVSRVLNHLYPQTARNTFLASA